MLCRAVTIYVAGETAAEHEIAHTTAPELDADALTFTDLEGTEWTYNFSGRVVRYSVTEPFERVES
jgi:hypothetical protein